MLEDGRRFDWSIIEEAGKAHGFDLALALQASHRLLLIGDQSQLPPYNFERFETLFREPPRILNALKMGAQFAPGLIDRAFMNLDANGQIKFSDSCSEWLPMVQFFAELFLRATKSTVAGVSIAQQLKFQHRMHPEIAKLVSECFYKGRLKTHPDAIKRFSEEPPPYSIVAGSWLPAAPVVFIDMPWVQQEKFAGGEEGGDGAPRYSNPTEIEAVGRVLSTIRSVDGVSCHVQVISPYRAQVRRIASAIGDRMRLGADLENLLAPEFDMDVGKRKGATVDEFQGSEADIIIASLVRNNDEKPGKGLGFLADPRRVNVLVSRARHKLVLIGSWNFMESRIDCSVEPNGEEELAHIARLIRFLKHGRQTGSVAVVPYSLTKGSLF